MVEIEETQRKRELGKKVLERCVWKFLVLDGLASPTSDWVPNHHYPS